MGDESQILDFLKRRYASAIRRGDDRTAKRLRVELDRLMNGRLAGAGQGVSPDLPPAA